MKGRYDTYEAAQLFNTGNTVVNQLEAAYLGYAAVAKVLDEHTALSSPPIAEGPDRIADEFNDWYTPGIRSYVDAAETREPGTEYHLVALPNITIRLAELMKLYKRFGEGQPKPTQVSSAQLLNMYSPDELSGTAPWNGNAAQFRLISSNGFTGKLQTVKKAKHHVEAAAGSDPHRRDTSPYEDIAYLYRLRAGNLMNGGNRRQLTYHANLGLRYQRIGPSMYVPFSIISKEGHLGVGEVSVKSSTHYRPAIG
jgi:hypothetical protein